MSVDSRAGAIHYRHYFHPAGHGTFFSGHIRSDGGSPRDDLVWVYDCGSRKWSQMDRLISSLVVRLAPKRFVDMVCISHFDSDHVHGMETLLGSVKVGALVLPYLSLQARLGLACQLSGSEPSSHRLAAMITDPSHYLAERGLRDRVGRIIMVQGEPSPDSDGAVLSDDEPRRPDVSREDESLARNIRVATRPLGAQEVGYQEDAWIEIARHDQPWMLGGLYELMFFNHALPGDVAPQSGDSLSDVAAEIASVIAKHGLCATAVPKSGWLNELKKLYGHHFGSSPRDKNDISLCALGRPITRARISACQKFQGDFPHPCRSIPWRAGHPQQAAVLLTGDITLDSSELAALKQHVGLARWEAVGVMQVPHHGSVRSWQIGLSAACVHSHSVICAAPSAMHPSEIVVQDLKARNPVIASYQHAVALDYHTC